MSSQFIAGFIHDVSLDKALGSLLANDSAVIVGRDEADLLTLGLIDNGQMPDTCFFTDFLFAQVSDWEDTFLQNRVGDGGQEVGLILVSMRSKEITPQ